MKYIEATISTVLAAAAVPFTLAGRYSGCPDAQYPREQCMPHMHCKSRCDDKHQSINELVKCASGSEIGSYDDVRVDFDIFRDVVALTSDLLANVTGLDDPFGRHGLKGVTAFIPNDEAFYKFAMEAGYPGDYNETAIVEFLLGDPFIHANEAELDDKLVAVLLYHVSETEYHFDELRDGLELDTLYGRISGKDEQIVISEEANEQPPCDERVRLKDTLRRLSLETFSDALDGFPKIHNRHKDMHTANGQVHAIKGVLIPAVFEDMMPNTTDH